MQCDSQAGQTRYRATRGRNSWPHKLTRTVEQCFSDMQVYVYYWDGRDGSSFEGWWFGKAKFLVGPPHRAVWTARHPRPLAVTRCLPLHCAWCAHLGRMSGWHCQVWSHCWCLSPPISDGHNSTAPKSVWYNFLPRSGQGLLATSQGLEDPLPGATNPECAAGGPFRLRHVITELQQHRFRGLLGTRS